MQSGIERKSVRARLTARPGRRCAAACVLVLSAACAACEDPLSPEVERASAVTVSPAAQQASPFHPNAVRYSDAGAHASTGRAGLAVLSAWALVDAAGRTELTVVADTATMGNPLPANGPALRMVQVKGYSADGRLRFTRNHAPGPGRTAARYALGGLAGGDRVQVQATVSGADSSRTGVVTLSTGVLRRPRLRVESVSAPIRAAARTAINISALVRETNGDVGAVANCALYVNGLEVDRAWGIWIDAGNAASCAFMHFFPAVGTYDLEVRVIGVQPRPFEPEAEIPAANATVAVIHIPSAFSFSASFEDRTFEDASRAQGSFRLANGNEGHEWGDEWAVSGRVQNGMVWAWMPRAVTFPLTELFVRQYTRDEIAHSAFFRDMQPLWTYEDEYERTACVARDFMNVNGRAWLHLCSTEYLDEYGGSATSVSYERYAGLVTYHSRGYSRYWNRDLGIDDVWSWNNESSESTGRFVSYGFEYGFALRIVDGSGSYTMNPLVWMQPFEHSFEQPWTCSQRSDPWASQEWCGEWRSAAHGVQGAVWGEPTY